MHWILLSKCSCRERNVEWLCGIVEIKAVDGSWLAILEPEAIYDSVTNDRFSKQSTSEKDSTRLDNTHRSTVTAFAAGCCSADYILPAACCMHVLDRRRGHRAWPMPCSS